MNSLSSVTFVSQELLSQEQFERWVAQQRASDPNRYELIEGRIVMHPPVGWPEGEAELSIGSLLKVFVDSRRLGRVFGPNQGFELPTGDTIAPDAAFISRERWESAPRPEPGRFLRIVPELAVEVVSPAPPARDRVQKRAIYAQAGVREYWLVDQRRRELTIFRLASEGLFDAGRTLGEHERFGSALLPGLELSVRDLLVEP